MKRLAKTWGRCGVKICVDWSTLCSFLLLSGIFAQGVLAQADKEQIDLKTEAGRQSKGMMSANEKSHMEKRANDLRLKLEECHQGKRDDKEKYLILKKLLQTYGLLGTYSSPEAVATKKEWDELRKNRPSIEKDAPTEIAEQREQVLKSDAKRKRVADLAKKFVPRDMRARVYWSGTSLAAVYQYRIEFYRVSDVMKPFYEHGNSFRPLDSGAEQGEMVDVRFFSNGEEIHVAPSKTITFGKKIAAIGGCNRESPKCDYFAIYPEKANEDYAFNDDSEREALLHLKRKGTPYKWNNPKADFQEVYGVISTEGEIVALIPFVSEYPDRILQALVVYPDGTSVFGIGSVIHDKEDEGYLRFGGIKGILVWSKNGVEKLSPQEAETKYPLLLKSPWIK